MNKSKFLKKSLAMLLALMLVFAMIPLSASAASDSDPTIVVNGSNYLSPVSGTYSYVMEAIEGEALSTVALAAAVPGDSPEGTVVAFVGKKGDIDSADWSAIDLEEEANKNGDVYSFGVEVRQPNPENDDKMVTVANYTLAITVKYGTESNNAAIASVAGFTNMASFEVGVDTITITAKFGTSISLPTSNFDEYFIPADKNVKSVNLSGTTLTVIAQDDTKKDYTVKTNTRSGFVSFEVPGQIGETEYVEDYISSFDSGNNEVNIEVPYGYSKKSVIPTFELGEDVVAMSLAGNVEVKSGETELNLSSPLTIYLWTKEIGSTGNPYVKYVVTLTEADNTSTALDTITVGTGTAISNVTPVVEGTTNVEMPASYVFATATSETVKVVGAYGAKVEVLGTTNNQIIDDAEADGTYSATLSGVNISGKEIRLRVTAEDDEMAQQDYIITLSNAPVEGVELTNFIVKGDVDGDGVDEIYEMDEDYTVTLPYMAKAMLAKVTTLGDPDKDPFRLYLSASTGATIKVRSSTYTSGSALTWTFNPKPVVDTALEQKITVENGGNTKTYTIKLAYEDGLTGRDLTSATMVGVNDVEKITPDNTYNTVLGTATDKNDTDKTVKTLRVNVPYSYGKAGDTAEASTVFSALNLSEGAVAYVRNAGQSTGAVTVLDEDNAGTLIKVPTNIVDSNNVIDTTPANATVVWVISEEGYVDQMVESNGSFGGAQITNLVDADKATAYYIYGVNAKAQTGADLLNIQSTVDPNVTARLVNKTVEITVPWSYVDVNAATVGKTATRFTLDFDTSPMATVKANNTPNDKISSDLGVADNDEATKFMVDMAGKTPTLYVPGSSGAVSALTVYSEDDVNQKTTIYDVVVKVNEAETGSQLTGVSAAGVNATIDQATRKASIVLPYNTEKFPVQLELEASKLATIKVDGVAYDPETGYNLNNDLKITVTSEDGDNVLDYTLTATVAESFFDVAKDQWYYDEVLKAASLEWINGTKPGYYEPNGTMTRGDFALIIARIKNYNPALYTESAFPDVESTDYYSAAIAYCKEMGYLGGENGYFNPKDPITREEMAKIICNAAGVKQVTDPTSPYADDDTIAEWAKGYVYGCQAAEIMMGDENANTFDARSNATRAEAAAVLVRAFA